MRNWGIGLLICGGLAIVGIISEPQEDYKEGLFGTAVFLVGGGYLYNKGRKYLNTMREVAEYSLNQIREKEGKIMLISNAEVVHDDRVYFREFLEHQLKWGSHQYYTLYKENFFNNKLKLLFYPCFFIIYPILMPLINLFLSFLIILPWVKKKFYFILLQPLIYLVYLLKGLFTLKESISDSKNIFVS